MPKREKNDPKYFEQVAEIKRRLNQKCPILEDGVQEGISSIVKGLNYKGYNFSRSMVEGTLNQRTSSLNTIVVLALCEYWNIDIKYIFSNLEGDSSQEMDEVTYFKPSKDFIIVDDQAYLGDYYCYMYSRDNGSRTLWFARLNLSRLDHTTTAKLVITERDHAGNVTGEKILEGIPYISAISNNILVILKDQLGSFAVMTMSYSPYLSGQMNYRLASFLSYSLEHVKLPRMQKAVILRHEAKEENFEQILGLLKMEQGHVLIRKEDFDALVAEHRELQIFKDDYGKIIEANKFEFYCFSNDMLRSVVKEYEQKDEKNLLLIKSKSIEPFYIEVPLDGSIRELAKDL